MECDDSWCVLLDLTSKVKSVKLRNGSREIACWTHVSEWYGAVLDLAWPEAARRKWVDAIEAARSSVRAIHPSERHLYRWYDPKTGERVMVMEEA